MARISTYPLAEGEVLADDKLLGTDKTTVKTKNFEIGALTAYFNSVLGTHPYYLPNIDRNNLSFSIRQAEQVQLTQIEFVKSLNNNWT
tara:strand:+ start:3536 stop:3799 length:264 start_codon:yes stop_codon:yes gene_type:complete